MSFIQFRFILILFLSLSRFGQGYPSGKRFDKCSFIYMEECKGTMAVSAELIPEWVKIGLEVPPEFSDEMQSNVVFSVGKRKGVETLLISVFHFLNQNKFRVENEVPNYVAPNGIELEPLVINSMLHE